MAIKDGYKAAAVAVALAVGLFCGRLDARVGGASPVVKTEQQLQQEMFEAVRQWLAGVPRQDQPKQIIAVKKDADNQYTVHMQMVQGEGWFKLIWTGQKWEVSGLQQPG